MNEEHEPDLDRIFRENRPVPNDTYRCELRSLFTEEQTEVSATRPVEPPARRRKSGRRRSEQPVSRQAQKAAWSATLAYAGCGCALLVVPFFGVLGVGPMAA